MQVVRKRAFQCHTVSAPGGGVGTGMRFEDLNRDWRPDIAVASKTGTWGLLNKGLQ